MIRWILWPIYAAAEIVALLWAGFLVFFAPDGTALRWINAVEPLFPDLCWFRGGPWLDPSWDCLRAQLASRPAPVAVEVPEMSPEDMLAVIKQVQIDAEENEEQYGKWAPRRITEWFRERIKPIDSSRILKDGEREELEILRQVAKIIDDKRNAQWERRGAGPCQRMPDEIDNLLCDWYEIQAKREFDALRSSKGGA